MLLAIDTSSGSSVAVVDPRGAVCGSRTVGDTMRHAEVVGTLIEGALEDAGITPRELTAVVVGMGPGPFTGLRVGIAAARAFAFGAGLPVLPLVSHDAIAFEHYAAGGAGGAIVVTDARRRERYWSAYAGCDRHGIPLREDGPALARPDAVPHEGLALIDATQVDAGALGVLAGLLRAHGGRFAADEPLYLRSPDVTLTAGPKRVTA